MQVGQCLVLPLIGHISLHQSINSFHSQPSLPIKTQGTLPLEALCIPFLGQCEK